MDTSIFLHTIRYIFVIIIFLQIFGSVKRGDRTLMGRFQPNSSPKLEPIHSTGTSKNRDIRLFCADSSHMTFRNC